MNSTSSSLFSYLYILGTVLCTVIGQILIKWRVNEHGQLPVEAGEKMRFVFGLLLDPYVLFGFFMAFLAAICWMLAMTRFSLSHAYPLVIALLVLLTTLGAQLWLHENFSWARLSGVLLILGGVAVLTLLDQS